MVGGITSPGKSVRICRGGVIMKALVLYFSATGNTRKVADTIKSGLEESGIGTCCISIEEAGSEDLYDYDLVFLGTPSIVFLPARPVMDFIKERLKLHAKRGDIKLCSPRVPEKRAVVFCTYSGPYSGIDQATTAGKYMAQFLAIIGFEVVGEWYVVGEYHGSVERSTQGKLGDIRGRPNEYDLKQVKTDLQNLLKRYC
jgi:flavodoxin